MPMKRTAPQYVMCIFNEPNPASLELRKIYRTLPDAQAKRLGMIRVIDEENEDYLYPSAWFVPARLPARAGSVFESPRMAASAKRPRSRATARAGR